MVCAAGVSHAGAALRDARASLSRADVALALGLAPLSSVILSMGCCELGCAGSIWTCSPMARSRNVTSGAK